MCLVRSIFANLCPIMIHLNALDFNVCRFEEVISFFWRSVYIHAVQCNLSKCYQIELPCREEGVIEKLLWWSPIYFFFFLFVCVWSPLYWPWYNHFLVLDLCSLPIIKAIGFTSTVYRPSYMYTGTCSTFTGTHRFNIILNPSFFIYWNWLNLALLHMILELSQSVDNSIDLYNVGWPIFFPFL